jgi:hypothetical protein
MTPSGSRDTASQSAAQPAGQPPAPPFAGDQTAPCWVEITLSGWFLFTVNTGSGTIPATRSPSAAR